MENAHDSDFDVDYTISVIAKQLQNRDLDIDSVIKSIEEEKKEEKQHIIEKDGKKYINFGKYSGTLMDGLDKSYLYWLINKADRIPENVKSELKNYL